jgi:hypothetical protein
MVVRHEIAFSNVVQAEPLSLGIDAIFRPTLRPGIGPVGVGRLPVFGNGMFVLSCFLYLGFLFLPYFFLTYMRVLNVHTVHCVWWTRTLISLQYSPFLPALGFSLLQHLDDIPIRQAGGLQSGYGDCHGRLHSRKITSSAHSQAFE